MACFYPFMKKSKSLPKGQSMPASSKGGSRLNASASPKQATKPEGSAVSSPKSTPKSLPEGQSMPASSKGGSRSNGSALEKLTIKTEGSTISSPKSIPILYEERGQSLRVFEFDELRNATNDFNRVLKIGEGGFGKVYKGIIQPLHGEGYRMAVAIKKLNQKGRQGHKEWLAEVQFLGVVQHPNLVKLIGYCSVDSENDIQRLLVYEFMPKKSLEEHLFNRAFPVLSWNLRLQIALGAAQGLLYLHEGLEVQIIYRDFKASNVLLDKDFRPKLSDFGLAREGPTAGHTHVTTAVVGTYGYAAPDYIETGHLTVKSDVWSFGVFLYEMLTGRRSLEKNRPLNEQKLLQWVRQFPIESRKFNMIMDTRLRNEYSTEAAREVAKLANNCLVKNPKERPAMNEIIDRLKGAIQIQEKEILASSTNTHNNKDKVVSPRTKVISNGATNIDSTRQ